MSNLKNQSDTALEKPSLFLLIYLEVQQLAINFKSEFSSLPTQLQNYKNLLQ